MGYFFLLINNFTPKKIIRRPTTILRILESVGEIKLLKTVPSKAIIDRKNKVADTKPKAKINSSFLFRLSSMILLVRTQPQKTIVIGVDSVRSSP